MECNLETAIEQMANKEEGGLNYIYSKTYNFVYLRAKSIARRENDVQKLVKDVYLKLFEEASRIKAPMLYEWLGKQVYAMGCSNYRKKKEREAELLEMLDAEMNLGSVPDVEVAAETVARYLEQLPDLYQATVYAFYYDYMPIADIAELMDCDIAVIANRLNYSRKYMIKALENQKQDNDVELTFHIKVVREALRKWSADNCLGATTAQTLYADVCRSVGLQAGAVVIDGANFGGVNNTVVYYKADDLEPICSEVELYRKKIGKNKKLMVVVIAIASVVCVAVLTFVLLSGKEKEKTQKETKPNKVIESQEESSQKEEPKEESKEEQQKPSDADEKEEEEEEKPVEKANEYILSESSSRVLSREDLQGLSKEQLRLARNEIFARYGMIFGVEDLDAYFSSQEWYKPTIPGDEFYDRVEMNMIEEANLSLIWEVESEME